jgi:hypothetical protein
MTEGVRQRPGIGRRRLATLWLPDITILEIIPESRCVSSVRDRGVEGPAALKPWQRRVQILSPRPLFLGIDRSHRWRFIPKT